MKVTKKMIKFARLNGVYDRLYGDVVESFISEKYTNGQEKAIQRQSNTKPEEFEEYFAYCEQCKVRAREYLAYVEGTNDAI